MPFFLIIAFIFFIAIDVLIFFRMWNLVLVGLVFGVALIVLGLILKVFTPAGKEQPQQAAGSGDINRNTLVMGQGPSAPATGDTGTMGFGGVLFIIEATAVLGLLLYLFLR
jgi:hypothetical protein